jgi:hypothetical protein
VNRDRRNVFAARIFAGQPTVGAARVHILTSGSERITGYLRAGKVLTTREYRQSPVTSLHGRANDCGAGPEQSFVNRQATCFTLAMSTIGSSTAG